MPCWSACVAMCMPHVIAHAGCRYKTSHKACMPATRSRSKTKVWWHGTATLLPCRACLDASIMDSIHPSVHAPMHALTVRVHVHGSGAGRRAALAPPLRQQPQAPLVVARGAEPLAIRDLQARHNLDSDPTATSRSPLPPHQPWRAREPCRGLSLTGQGPLVGMCIPCPLMSPLPFMITPAHSACVRGCRPRKAPTPALPPPAACLQSAPSSRLVDACVAGSGPPLSGHPALPPACAAQAGSGARCRCQAQVQRALSLTSSSGGSRQ